MAHFGMPKNRHIANRIASRLTRLFGGDAGAGIVLMLAAAAAMAMANSAWAEHWHHLLHGTLGWTPVAKLDNLHLWINDGLMALFFFVVGLEIKREVLDGELSSAAKRRLPVMAAAAGMIVPAAIFLLVVRGEPGLSAGWAIPAATDIAFAVGVLGLLRGRVPASLRLFLLTVAIVDDIGAVLIIALFYTTKISLTWLLGAALVWLAMALLNRFGLRRGWPYALLGVALWYCVLHSGVHATIAGVAAALTIPLALDQDGDSLLLRMEHALTGWTAYLILPLFGLANAGVALEQSGLSALTDPLPLAIAAGLLLGKPIGIFLTVIAAERSGLARRPDGARTMHLLGVAMLCGIGFTMSLFIGALAFPGAPALVDEAKLGVLLGSVLSALGGYTVLRLTARTTA